MKVGGYADAHFAYSSSILPTSSDRYSVRLDALVDSFEWMYDVFDKKGVELIVNLGDLTSNHHLRGEEISAINEALSFSKGVPEYHILGNHEVLKSARSKNVITSVDILNIADHFDVIQEPKVEDNMVFFPFPKEGEEKISEQVLKYEGDILFSHLNILSEELMDRFKMPGVNHKVILGNYQKVLNGHIHKSGWIKKDRVVNVGTLAGHNFGDGYKLHKPSVFIIDTETLEIEFIENPHSIIFLKLKADSLYDVKSELDQFKEDGGNYALNIEVDYDIKDEVRELVNSYESVVSARIKTKVNQVFSSGMKVEDLGEKVTSYESGVDAFESFINSIEEPKFPKKDMKEIVSKL